jgi:hypothetical protein
MDGLHLQHFCYFNVIPPRTDFNQNIHKKVNGFNLEHFCYLNGNPPWTDFNRKYLYKKDERFTPWTFLLLEQNSTLNISPSWIFMKNETVYTSNIYVTWTEFHLEWISTLNIFEKWLVSILAHSWILNWISP